MKLSVRTHRRAALFAAALLTVLAAGSVSYWLTRSVHDVSPTLAQQEPTPEPFWYVPLFEEDASKPRLDATLAGITLGPDAPDADICAAIGRGAATLSQVGLAEAAAAAPELHVSPRYLPPLARQLVGSSLHQNGALSCGGAIGMVNGYYTFPRSSGNFGGIISIVRVRGGPIVRTLALDVAADRAEVGTVAGMDAVLIRPVIAGGLGQSFVIIAEPWGITWVEANGLPFAETLRIAESLY